MVNGGHLSAPPPPPPTSQQSSSASKSCSGGTGSGGKANGRGTKRRRPSQTSEVQHQPPPPPPTPPTFTPTTYATSTSVANHMSPIVLLADFAHSPPSLPQAANKNSVDKRGETDSPSSIPVPDTVSSTPVLPTAVQASLNHKHMSSSRSSSGNNDRVSNIAAGLNGSVCGSSWSHKLDHQGQHVDAVKVKKEEESSGWSTKSASKSSRDFSTATLKPEPVRPELFGTIFQNTLVHVPPVDTTSTLICSERVPGMISGDLKPVIQPVRHISMRQCPAPKNRTTPSKKNNDIDILPDPPESFSSVPQHPVDSPPSSQSAVESSPSPPSSPTLPPSLKKLSHSSSSSSLASSLSSSAPTMSIFAKNGVVRQIESTIQEREMPEEARMDADESILPSEDSPSSVLSDNLSEKERSPPSEQHPRSKGSQSPEGNKRRWRSYETEEEYEARKKLRRAELNFMVDFSKSIGIP